MGAQHFRLQAGASSKEKGFTLLEILIGLLVAGLVFVFAYSSVNFSSAVGADMREKTKVANVLESAAEKVMAMRSSFSSIPASIIYTSTDIPLMADFDDASCIVSVSDYGGDSSLKLVTVIFSWKPISQKDTKTQILKTLLSEPAS